MLALRKGRKKGHYIPRRDTRQRRQFSEARGNHFRHQAGCETGRQDVAHELRHAGDGELRHGGRDGRCADEEDRGTHLEVSVLLRVREGSFLSLFGIQFNRKSFLVARVWRVRVVRWGKDWFVIEKK